MNHVATYSPEDNKLRIYPGERLDDQLGEEYAEFKSAGYKWAAKQECFVCARWTPVAEDWALRLAGEIGDEDYSPLERSADRAERFGTYREKRRAEAHEHADTFESGPSAFGHQNQQRAERQAARLDRQRVKVVSQWSKAEYWQRRTEGVISHALYKARPDVRRGRIKKLESDIRAMESKYTPAEPRDEYTSEGITYVWCGKGRGGRWVDVTKLEAIKASWARMIEHCKMRLIYERGMLENEGGTAADVEMIPGGFVGGQQIQKVNKSPVTGAVVSVQINGKTVNIERLGEDAYRCPTDQELKAFKADQRKNKKKSVPLINPTADDARKLQSFWNSRSKNGAESVLEITGATYSTRSRSSDWYHTAHLFSDGLATQYKPSIAERINAGDNPVCKLRIMARLSGADVIVQLTDKPQKPLPLDWDNLGCEKPQDSEALSEVTA